MKVGPQVSAAQLGEIVIKLKTTADCQALILLLIPPLLYLSQLYTFGCSCYGNRINNRPVWCLWFQLGASHIEPSDSSHAGDGAVFQGCAEERRNMEADRETLSPVKEGATAERVCCAQSNGFSCYLHGNLQLTSKRKWHLVFQCHRPLNTSDPLGLTNCI